MWNTIKTWISNFWTKEWTAFWGWLKVTVGLVAGAVIPGAQYLAGVVNQPKVEAALEQFHLDPKISLGLAVLGAITLLSMEHA